MEAREVQRLGGVASGGEFCGIDSGVFWSLIAARLKAGEMAPMAANLGRGRRRSHQMRTSRSSFRLCRSGGLVSVVGAGSSRARKTAALSSLAVPYPVHPEIPLAVRLEYFSCSKANTGPPEAFRVLLSAILPAR